MRTAAPGAPRRYSYVGVAYANPDAANQIANGLSTTAFSYGNKGNVTQSRLVELAGLGCAQLSHLPTLTKNEYAWRDHRASSADVEHRAHRDVLD
jgi:hypothetical protein